jgi:branched-chain amino acid transport system ATP-binding protein
MVFDNEDTKFWKNLLLPNKRDKEKETIVKKTLKSLEMEKFENKPAKDLSYGQKRLIEIMRTILNPHDLLILDEPVAGVNPVLRQKIQEILRDLKKKGDTTLLIEHDMDFVLGIADEVIVMDEGRVIAKGTPSEIKNNPRVLKAYLGD